MKSYMDLQTTLLIIRMVCCLTAQRKPGPLHIKCFIVIGALRIS